METLKEMSDEIVLRAMRYGIKSHEETNHKYSKTMPYAVHLGLVFQFAVKYSYLLPKDKLKFILAACWVHDCIEDARQTYNDVKYACGVEVADLAFALTNFRGKVRDERACDEYYVGIRDTEFATFLKLCDRLANTYFSLLSKSTMRDTYRREQEHFTEMLYVKDYDVMFKEIELMLKN